MYVCGAVCGFGWARIDVYDVLNGVVRLCIDGTGVYEVVCMCMGAYACGCMRIHVYVCVFILYVYVFV